MAVYDGEDSEKFCGIDVLRASGTIRSPGSPMNIPDEMDFWWHFHIPTTKMAVFVVKTFETDRYNGDLLLVYEEGVFTDM